MNVSKNFWSRIEISPITGCWEWSGTRDKDGYGRVRIHGRLFGAHRVSWEINHGQIPDGLYVCHHCDNPPCINPDHLFLGTYCEDWRSRHEEAKRDAAVDDLIEACEKLLDYRRRNTASFQLEKADDFFREIAIAIRKARGAV